MKYKIKIYNKLIKILNRLEEKDSIKFVKKELKKLVKIFPDIKCIYIYDDFNDTHIVQLHPIEINDDEEILEAESNITDKFVDIFPYKMIVFTNEDYSKKYKLIKIYEGKFYREV